LTFIGGVLKTIKTMANQRAEGKRLIGAQASAELWAGVDEWLSRHPEATTSDFVLKACLEKLEREHIPIDSVEALRDRRGRLPTPTRPDPNVKYKLSNSTAASGAAKLLRKHKPSPGSAAGAK
jgi:hypothetical protein